MTSAPTTPARGLEDVEKIATKAIPCRGEHCRTGHHPECPAIWRPALIIALRAERAASLLREREAERRGLGRAANLAWREAHAASVVKEDEISIALINIAAAIRALPIEEQS